MRVTRRRVAFAFAGQGADEPRMGLAMAEDHPPAAALLDHASERTGTDLRTAMRRGLRRTSHLQPAMVSVALGALSALEEHVRPDVVLGHSLGEIAAWAASGALSGTAAIDLAAARGEAMERAAEINPGGMLALRPCGLASAARALEAGREAGFLDVAAQNAADEWVLSGSKTALRVAARVTDGTLLRVEGPWHARVMRGAAAPFTLALERAPTRSARVPLVANATGSVARPSSVPRLLVRQLARPVKWMQSMHTLLTLGVTDLVTVGPAKVVRHLARRTLGDAVRLHSVLDMTDVERVAGELTA